MEQTIVVKIVLLGKLTDKEGEHAGRFITNLPVEFIDYRIVVRTCRIYKQTGRYSFCKSIMD
ncbi:hypothetical protein [Paenibacillus validus]|uniref:hypothetical protein n=1 Tax=Paenibacillus validus TaxID=44253 RepID=UPI003D28A668